MSDPGALLDDDVLDDFLVRCVEREGMAAAVARDAGIPVATATSRLGDIASEARRAISLLRSIGLRPGQRVLEIGSGPGIAAAFLAQQGFDVTGLDPVTGGFDLFDVVRSAVADQTPMPTIWPIAAEQLDPATHGRFDVIFSVNVLEHMHPLDANLDGIARVLADDGRMIHTCPNYRIPYEPHYRLPLVPARPGLTARLARSTGREPLWQSLNWITPADLNGWSERSGLRIDYREGELAGAIARLRTDSDFARRQGGLVTKVLLGLDRLRVTRLIARLPATWETPMTFVVTRRARPGVGAASPSELVSGVRSVFSLPWAYRAAQWLIGATRFRRHVVGELVDARPGERVLDIGCGTADIVDDLPDCDYVGIDHSDAYIDAARQRFGTTARFMTASAAEAAPVEIADRTVAMMVGVLHHLNDAEALEALQLAKRSLAAEGRFVSIDPTFADGQHAVGRWLASRDRGQHVRTPEQTAALVGQVFESVNVGVRHDLLRVPYSHVTVQAR